MSSPCFFKQCPGLTSAPKSPGPCPERLKLSWPTWVPWRWVASPAQSPARCGGAVLILDLGTLGPFLGPRCGHTIRMLEHQFRNASNGYVSKHWYPMVPFCSQHKIADKWMSTSLVLWHYGIVGYWPQNKFWRSPYRMKAKVLQRPHRQLVWTQDAEPPAATQSTRTHAEKPWVSESSPVKTRLIPYNSYDMYVHITVIWVLWDNGINVCITHWL